MRRVFLIGVLFLTGAAFLTGQNSPTSFQSAIVVTDNIAAPKTLLLGIDPAATDSIDVSLQEEELPPMPPAGNFEARFILPKGNFSGELSSYKDYRQGTSPFTGQKTFRLHFQKSTAAGSVVIKWNLPPGISGTLKDIISGAIINVSVSGSGEYTVTNPAAFNKLTLQLNFDNIPLKADNPVSGAADFRLEQNYPNPFNPSTTISYTLPAPGFVTLRVYSMNQELVAELKNGYQEAGTHTAVWQAPKSLSSGVYFYSFQLRNAQTSPNGRQTVKQMVLIK